jgi:hypothetical protein
MLRRISTIAGVILTLFLVLGSAESKELDSAAQLKLRAEFTVSKGGYRPDVAELNGGGFVVVWRSDAPFGVNAQRYNSKGKKVGPTISVIEEAQEFMHPVVAGLSTGGFVVAYEYDDGSGVGVYAQRYTASGERDGGHVRANTFRPNNQF